MKTMNTNEEAPNTFFVFLDFKGTLGYINKNNYQLTHKINSAGLVNIMSKSYAFEDFENGDIYYLPFVRTGVSMHEPSTFMMGIINDYYVEYCLEWFRKENYQKYPSRFSGIFAFGDYESCERVSRKHGWDLESVKKFKLNHCYKITKMNMEIVSLMRGVFMQGFPPNEQEAVCKAYWDGVSNIQAISHIYGSAKIIDSSCVYEYLIEGCLEEIE